MGEVRNLQSRRLAEAVAIWTGWGISQSPRRNDALVAAHFGKDLAAQLLPMVKSLADDYYSSDARFLAADMQEMEMMAEEDFRKKHPDVEDSIVRAFSWCYTFDFR